MKVYFEMLNHHEFFQIFCSNSEENIKSSVAPFFSINFKWGILRNFIMSLLPKFRREVSFGILSQEGGY